MMHPERSTSMPPVRRKQPTAYNKPRRLNAVSFTMMLFLAVSVYLVYCLWPAVALRLRVKGDLEDVMNRYWRANLQGGEQLRQVTAQLRQELTTKLRADGVKDRKLELVFTGGKQRIAIEAHFTAPVTLLGLDRTYSLPLSPRAETDAARVDW